MKTIYWALVALFLGFGAYRIFGLKIQNFQMKDEAWLYSIVPDQVDTYSVVPGPVNSKISYRMDDKTYKELKPVGISGQTFRGPNGTVDAVIVAGDRMESFHDQRWCFKAQGWDVSDEKFLTLNIPDYGKVPMYWMTLKREGEPPHRAAFTFLTPEKFRTNYQAGQVDYILKELQTGHPNVGFSFRFIELDPGMGDDEFVRFIHGFFREAKKSSNNVLWTKESK